MNNLLLDRKEMQSRRKMVFGQKTKAQCEELSIEAQLLEKDIKKEACFPKRSIQ